MFTNGRSRSSISWLILLLTAALVLASAVPAAAQGPVVRGLLFYSPTCPHCHTVIDEVLPELQARYGGQLRLLYVDVSELGGQVLYQAAVGALSIPPQRRGVPTIVVGRRVLVGAIEIPEQLPAVIEQGLANDGVVWPPLPGLEAALAQLGALEEGWEEPAESASTNWRARFNQDPTGNSLSVLVLVAIASALGLGVRWWGQGERALSQLERSILSGAFWQPLLSLAGLAVAGYLTLVESAQTSAVCGPIGDCNSVQSSAFASLFGVPVGLLGAAAYLALLGLWGWQRWGGLHYRAAAALASAGLALVGTLFSLYLTFLEPFVIGATCLWCLTSALLMSALLLVTVPRAIRASALRVGPRRRASA